MQNKKDDSIVEDLDGLSICLISANEVESESMGGMKWAFEEVLLLGLHFI